MCAGLYNHTYFLLRTHRYHTMVQHHSRVSCRHASPCCTPVQRGLAQCFQEFFGAYLSEFADLLAPKIDITDI